MKFAVVVICAVAGVAVGESADDQQADVVNGQNQPQAQDRLFELSRKSRQLFGKSRKGCVKVGRLCVKD